MIIENVRIDNKIKIINLLKCRGNDLPLGTCYLPYLRTASRYLHRGVYHQRQFGKGIIKITEFARVPKTWNYFNFQHLPGATTKNRYNNLYVHFKYSFIWFAFHRYSGKLKIKQTIRILRIFQHFIQLRALEYHIIDIHGAYLKL